MKRIFSTLMQLTLVMMILTPTASSAAKSSTSSTNTKSSTSSTNTNTKSSTSSTNTNTKSSTSSTNTNTKSKTTFNTKPLYKTKGGKGAQVAEPELDYTSQVLNNFMSFYKMGIDEKLYLQTDKHIYSSGENIWFKGYVLNAITHSPLNFTNFIYTELLNNEGVLVSRAKVQRDDNGFNGYITLNPTMTPGDYTLRSYTKWMTNKDDGFFYTKNIKIVSAITESTTEVDQSDKAAVRAAERAAAQAAAEAAKAEKAAADKAARAAEYRVQFFPEGGALLTGVSQIVAFKALAGDGLSVEVTGVVRNSKGEEVADIATTHKGMGLLQMSAEEGEQYVATVTTADGLERAFRLPAAEAQGVAIKVIRVGERAIYQIITNAPELIQGGHVIIHSRGQIITVSNATLAPAALSMETLRSGVSTFAVVDSNGQVIAERLIFKKPTDLPKLTFKSSAQNYNARSLATFRVSVTDSDGAPLNGDFAVSVTDNSAIERDPAKDNMLSYLHLTSDIKGHIEEPGLYFEEDSPAMDYKLDLLMRTQAWRRFDLTALLQEKIERPTTLYEDVAYISGSVKGFFGNEARRPRVAVMCSKVNYWDAFELDESSNFRLVGLNIPDSTTYIIKAQGRNGGNSLTLKVDPEVFPKADAGIFSRKEQEEPPQAFINQSKDKFFYEGGMQTIELETISVTTSARSKSAEGAFATQSTTREILETMSGMTLEDVIRTFPNMQIGDSDVYYRGSSDAVKFMVDGVDDDFISLGHLTANDIEQIDFFTGADAAAFSDASGGVFTITLREVNLEAAAEHINMAYITPLGYQHPIKFFQPSYEIASVKSTWPPDFRSTIYWDGKLKADSYGNINFGFYTADKATSYTVTIEGISDSGEVCIGSTTIERTLATF
ncbi:MAG: TonB-dependent receptor plug domain-containing protein [Rikenellaceae bacterium]